MATNTNNNQSDSNRFRSVFDLSSGLFDCCRLLHEGTTFNFQPEPFDIPFDAIDEETLNQVEDKIKKVVPRWSCNTCKAEFDSLQDQRSHFKSDHHRFNIKLNIAGKDTVKEEDFDELASDSLFKDYDISSISGSEDEAEKTLFPINEMHGKGQNIKRKLFIRLQTGEVVSIWKCLLLKETDSLLFDDKLDHVENGRVTYLRENEVVERLKGLTNEPRDKTQLRIVLLASGGHFAGCVFDGNSVVAHKTFHRYVVRAKAGKKQSTKDASGRAAHSAGASLRRYNELALKKEIQELFANWRPYFDISSCIFINAPSNSRQLLYNGEKPYFSDPHHVVRHIPVTVRRPTLKEAKRIYTNLTNVQYEVDEKGSPPSVIEDSSLFPSGKEICNTESREEQLVKPVEKMEIAETSQVIDSSDGLEGSTENDFIGITTPLHVAATSSDAQKTLELLEQGLDPCVKDERGRTPYMLANDKEVRNTFRRFMALNLDKWDWNAAKVPSPLTKEMEESQAAKQAEKDAKRKAKAKELKKLKKAKEKKAQAEAALAKNAPPTTSKGQGVLVSKQQTHSIRGPALSKEEEAKRAQAAEREKRAQAAEKRMAAAAALNAQATSSSTTVSPSNSNSNPNNGISNGVNCSCCNSSLAGKIPFHRYNYKYCSTTCMHVHREMLEDE